MQNSNFPVTITEARICRLNRIENYLFYNRYCEPKKLFHLYRRIWQQHEVIVTGSQAEYELLKSGLVVLDCHKLKPNPTFNENFNENWIENQLARLQPYSKIRLRLYNLDIKATLPYKVLTEVDAWTGNQPFLTQKLCQLIRDRISFIPRNQEAVKVSELVYHYIIDDWQRGLAATHLSRLLSLFLSYPGSISSLLLCYQEIWHSRSIFWTRTPEQLYLLKINLISLEKDKVKIANRIYRDVFNYDWIEDLIARSNNSILSFEKIDYSNSFSPRVHDEVKSNNFAKWVKIIVLLICLGGIAGLGIYLKNRYDRVQQIQQGDRLLAQKKYSAAITAYDRLLQTDIAQPHLLWVNRGYAFSGLNEYDDMLQSCSEAIEIEPDAALAWNCRGEALYHLKQDREALDAFERAAQIDSQPIFWLNQAVVLDRFKKYERAIAASEKAIELSSTKPQRAMQRDLGGLPHERLHQEAIAFYLKGQSLLKIGRYERASVAFEQSLANSANYLPAKQGLAIALYQLGRDREAIAAFESVLQSQDLTQEQTAVAMSYQAASLCQIGKTNAAGQIFSQIIKLTDDPQLQKIARTGCGIR